MYLVCRLLLDTAPHRTYLYALSLHDALPILASCTGKAGGVSMMIQSKIGVITSSSRFMRSFRSNSLGLGASEPAGMKQRFDSEPFCTTLNSDRKSTRLNSSHRCISYAVFCLTLRHTARTSTPFPYTTLFRSWRHAPAKPAAYR